MQLKNADSFYIYYLVVSLCERYYVENANYITRMHWDRVDIGIDFKNDHEHYYDVGQSIADCSLNGVKCSNGRIPYIEPKDQKIDTPFEYHIYKNIDYGVSNGKLVEIVSKKIVIFREDEEVNFKYLYHFDENQNVTRLDVFSEEKGADHSTKYTSSTFLRCK